MERAAAGDEIRITRHGRPHVRLLLSTEPAAATSPPAGPAPTAPPSLPPAR
jgi:antitoxin (DNA-binding transcriptional repressor) of toxin-antitoxin stability system